MTRLRAPTGWAEEYSRVVFPDLFEPSRAEQAEVCLSYPERAPWLADYTTTEVAEDLVGGMVIETVTGNDGRYYRLTGTRFDVYARPREALNSGAQQAYVTSVKPARGLGRTETVRPGAVWFAQLWDEEFCDLAELAEAFTDGLQIAQKRRSVLDRARRGLSRTSTAARPRGDLHARLRRQYQPLVRMLELLEQRSLLEGEVRGAGVVVGEALIEGQPVLRLRLDRKAEFVEGRTIAVNGPGPGSKTNLRVRAIETDGQHQLLALAAPRSPIPPDTRLRLAQQGRFSLGKHSSALRKFLDEQVEGDWEHLALLLSAPSRLPVAGIRPLERYFDDRLNGEQRAAVDGAVGSPHAYYVQGPPGTGKTTVITEVVRQLTARGERVLLLAPMHVAVDEVLRRVADQPGILALRISWDESRVATQLRRYLPEQVTRTYLQQARRPETSQADRWRVEIDQLGDQLAAVDALRAATVRRQWATEGLRAAAAAQAEWREQLAALTIQAHTEHSEAEQSLRKVTGTVTTATTRAVAIREQLTAVPRWRRIWARARGLAGATDAVAHLSAEYRVAEADRRRLADVQRSWARRRDAALAQLAETERERRTRAPEYQVTVDRWRAEMETVGAEVATADGRLRTLVGHDLPRRTEADLIRWRDQLAGEVRRRHHRIALEQRWFDLSGVAGGSEDALAAQVDADLRRSANLVCCTTTGVTRNLGDSDFDTLIVDEASRVVDSEFLIGAVRARRWILVGDQHQLPPYVEPADEHHLHALAALHHVERGAAGDLPAAVDLLGQLWAEDEEVHQFRTDAVLRVAENLRATGSWQREYRATFETAWRRFREVDGDAERTLLSAMRDHLVRSLFERSVGTLPRPLRQPLRLQRRMIEPIAALVSQPIYGGDYLTPDDPDVTPLRYGGTNTPVVLVDTSVYGQKAAERLAGSGFANDLEAELIARMCRSWEDQLRRSGSDPVTVSVLTFYRRQAAEIRDRLGAPAYPDFRALNFEVVDAIDKIQGRESDLVFLSFCRTFRGRGRPSPRFGRWLQDVRRLNVACTRARRALVLVGHEPTLRRLNGVPAAEEFYRNLFTMLAERPEMVVVKGVR